MLVSFEAIFFILLDDLFFSLIFDVILVLAEAQMVADQVAMPAVAVDGRPGQTDTRRRDGHSAQVGRTSPWRFTVSRHSFIIIFFFLLCPAIESVHLLTSTPPKKENKINKTRKKNDQSINSFDEIVTT